MCFQVNKDYAGELNSGKETNLLVGAKKGSPADIADKVAVQGGVKNVKNNRSVGFGGNSHDPANIKGRFMSAKSNLVYIVSTSVDNVLKKHKVKSEKKRIDIAMDTVDEVLRFIENPEHFKKNNEQ